MVNNNDGNPIEGLPPSKGDDIFGIDYADLVLENVIGRGSFGQVQKASYFGTEVAVKSLSSLVSIDPDYYKFMQREIRILMDMRHPNIVQYIGSCKHEEKNEEKHMIITEFINGGDLHQYLKSKGQSVTWQLKIKLALDIASACMNCSYNFKKVIFRDLKAKNILIEEHGASVRAKVCDFGFARIFDVSNTIEKKQGYLTICGSETTMAPEVIVGSNYDETCDVYSFGILLYEMICGIRVVKNELKRLPQEAFDLDCDKAYQYVPPACPKVFCELARLCVSYEPRQRPSFKTICMGLSDLNSKPFETLALKGGNPVSLLHTMVSPRSNNNNSNGSGGGSGNSSDNDDNNNSGGSGGVKENNSVVFQGSVIYNNNNNDNNNNNNTINAFGSIVLEQESKVEGVNQFLAEAQQQQIKKNRITNSSFFKPPTTDSANTTSSTTTSSNNSSVLGSSSPDGDSFNVPSTLLTSLTLNEIKYRDPSFFEDPDKIIQEKKRYLSTPNLGYNNGNNNNNNSDNSNSDDAEKQKPVNLSATLPLSSHNQKKKKLKSRKKKKRSK
ncbi:LISK family protein kinase [Heterostelium album PN500]|uniref:non-specific serine/threonine protein kinase n=1 Tax=Heterostelium pallidum (strain ATCC 26659 / Pp 5 / PN500) TaxID=670386 RepID=D3AVW1_HETP5|nr:LISK family protein kinase [Heterostelium album PN500]EFA86434.1 LISK family protein kinase [Heterostelium album PN500]|eukprot:XP_020438539.1 LISK family protein kinase [Heterostelium album PN500]